MPLKIVTKIATNLGLRRYLQRKLEALPQPLPLCNQEQLLNDLCFLLQSPIFLYAIKPRTQIVEVASLLAPLTPVSMCSEDGKTEHEFDVRNFSIRVDQDNYSCATQLLYGNKVILEGRHINPYAITSFEQSLTWFCEEANFLAYEFKAREHALAVRMGTATDAEPFRDVDSEHREKMVGQRRSGAKADERRTLKLMIRLRNSARGRAGAWRL